jgi:pimeloyl-ACP methyl ester carboxylesterase
LHRTSTHVPTLPAWLQLWQVPVAVPGPAQATLQQMPSTQLSEVHSASSPHVVPFLKRHPPTPSQVFSPEQSASSVNLGTAVQFPWKPATAHDWQLPQAALLQQTPSTQLPDAQSLEMAQAFPSRLRHAPVASQTESPPQVSSVAFVIGEQVPTLPVSTQLSHDPSQALSQQTPSTQKPLAHCAPTVHAWLAGWDPPSAGGAAVASAALRSAAMNASGALDVPPSASMAPLPGPQAASDAAPISRPARAASIPRFTLRVRLPIDAVAVVFMFVLAGWNRGTGQQQAGQPENRPPVRFSATRNRHPVTRVSPVSVSQSGVQVVTKSESMTGDDVSFTEVDRLSIAYREAGQGPAIVLLHGFLCDSRCWRAQLSGLSDQFRVVAWDAPGAGRSSDPPRTFTTESYARCLAGFLDAVGVAGAHVVGLSWGGILAQELCRLYPRRLRSLVLADTYAGWRGSLPEPAWKQRLATCLADADGPPEALVAKMLPGMFSDAGPSDVRDELAGIMREFHPIGFRLMAMSSAEVDTRDLLSSIHVPTLLLWGADDRRSPVDVAEQFRAMIPRAELAIIPNAGHVSNMEQPDAFNAHVRRRCLSA